MGEAAKDQRASDSGTRPAASVVGRRADVRVALEVEVSDSSESNFFVRTSRDVSPPGLFVATWRRLAVGTPLFVAIELPGGRLLADGEVTWTQAIGDGVTPGLGIVLRDLAPEHRARIDEFCRQRTPLQVDLA